MSKLQANECQFCGKSFLTHRPTQKYCSKGCRIDASHCKYEESSQLCWRCEKSTGKCSWSRSLVPVKGWTADPSVVRYQGEDLHTFRVMSCPEYVFE